MTEPGPTLTEFEQPPGRVRPSGRRPRAALAWMLVLVAVAGAGVAGRGPETEPTPPSPATAEKPGASTVAAASDAGGDEATERPDRATVVAPSSIWRLGGDGVLGSRGVDLDELRRGHVRPEAPARRVRLPVWTLDWQRL